MPVGGAAEVPIGALATASTRRLTMPIGAHGSA
jgi:hypothetical protein